MKKIPFTKDDYKTMAIFISAGIALFCFGYLTAPTIIEECFNCLKIAGAAGLIIALISCWNKYTVIPRNTFLLSGIGVICWASLHAYKVIFTHQQQSYLVNMGFHLTVLTAYFGFTFLMIKRVFK